MNSIFQGKSPEVTVLTSCYNASRWLREAIDSILRQTFEDFEFILVDDGSTDDTWSIMQTYRDRDQRIFSIRKKNTGLSDSLNVGMAHARGSWIARLDADDLCEPDRLAEQLSFVRNHQKVVLLGTGFLEINEQGELIKKQRYPSDHGDLVRHLRRSQRFSRIQRHFSDGTPRWMQVVITRCFENLRIAIFGYDLQNGEGSRV